MFCKRNKHLTFSAFYWGGFQRHPATWHLIESLPHMIVFQKTKVAHEGACPFSPENSTDPLVTSFIGYFQNVKVLRLSNYCVILQTW